MLGAIGSASGGVSAATASIIGGGDRLLAGTVSGVGTGGLIATLLFLAARDLPALLTADRDRPSPAVGTAATGASPGITGRFAHHVARQPEGLPPVSSPSGVAPQLHRPGATEDAAEDAAEDGVAADETDAAHPVGSGPATRVQETDTDELFDLLGTLIAKDDRAWAEQPERDKRGSADRAGLSSGSGAGGTGSYAGFGDEDWPASLAAILGEALPDPTLESGREPEPRDGTNPAGDQGPATIERPPEASRFCGSTERRNEPGCSARDHSGDVEHGLRDGHGRNRRRHRPR
ncbi:MAG: hypothetical protein ACKV2O_13840 [Acidimicrobiales bacterium]